jgi:ornithine carbamoyltransferase
MTLHEHAHLFGPEGTTVKKPKSDDDKQGRIKLPKTLPELRPLTIAYVGDSANVLHDMLVTFPRLGHKMRIATPADPKYRAPAAVWDRVVELGCDKNDGIWWGEDPKDAVRGADVVITDTWISMGQEAEAEQRLKDFQGYQITEELCRSGGANPNWQFMHCLPRKKHEVDDEVRAYLPFQVAGPELLRLRYFMVPDR